MSAAILGPGRRVAELRARVRAAMAVEAGFRAGQDADRAAAGAEAYEALLEGILADLAAMERIGALGEIERWALVKWGGS